MLGWCRERLGRLLEAASCMMLEVVAPMRLEVLG
jgi:hypothetical protein